MTEVIRKERKNHIARASWLLMLTEGGRWSSKEIRERLGRKDPSFHSHIFNMARTGYAIRYPGERTQYGVTPGCKVPTGVTLEEVLKAMGQS
jgi:DNA-binding MarR family transcriptional regulator